MQTSPGSNKVTAGDTADANTAAGIVVSPTEALHDSVTEFAVSLTDKLLGAAGACDGLAALDAAAPKAPTPNVNRPPPLPVDKPFHGPEPTRPHSRPSVKSSAKQTVTVSVDGDHDSDIVVPVIEPITGVPGTDGLPVEVQAGHVESAVSLFNTEPVDACQPTLFASEPTKSPAVLPAIVLPIPAVISRGIAQ